VPTIYIDDQAYEVPEGDNVLEACLNAELDLPYFCWHPEMGSVGACRQCALVQFRDEEDTQGRIVMGCMTPVSEGARFSMRGPKASQFRSNIVESLMLNHPHDCPVCAEGGECHLQDMTVMVGHRNRSYRGKKNTHTNQNLGPLIHHEMNRCITCYRCTRFYSDYAGGKDLAAQAAHDHVYFGRHEEGTLESEFAGNLVEVCPTGVFTDKPLVNDYTRKWDLQSAPSVCTGCAVGCNTLAGERYGKLKRIHNRYNNDVNGYFLCDRGRYGGSHVNDQTRPEYAGLRQSDGRYNAVGQEQALASFTELSADKRLVGIGSPRASLETNFLLQQLVGADNFANGIADDEAVLIRSALDAMRNSGVHSPSLREIEDADAIIILGEDVTNTAPRMALSLRQSVRNLAKQMATDMRIPLWQDEAVRNLAQDRLSPLYIVALSDTRLDDVAKESVSLAPNDIARFGFAVASAISNATSENSFDEKFDEETSALISNISAALKSAKRPLIVSGTGACNADVIQAAATIAQALSNSDAMLSFCFAESNSLGSVMLADQSLNLQDVFNRACKGEIDTLIIAENDLYRRAPKSQVDQLFDQLENVIVMDIMATPSLAKSKLALPSSGFAEVDGTLVNSEGRAQRHYPVYLPAEQRRGSWQWLNDALGDQGHAQFDEVTQACAAQVAQLSQITQASPPSDHLSRGAKIPRQTHRYSGRTAMRADISVHEPKQPQDTQSALAYTMEGDNRDQPGALLPFVWSPGWNSNQSLHKFQSEIGGALTGGTAGVRLIEREEPRQASEASSSGATQMEPIQAEQGQWILTPLYQIFGSEELSAHSPPIAELIKPPFVQLSQADADSLNAVEGDTLEVESQGEKQSVVLEINDRIPNGCAAYSVGLPGAKWLNLGDKARLNKQSAGGGDV